MGIKGIYRELGSGKRVSLSKLAADTFDSSNRPLRLAIDIAIWQFQNQAARGGTNPAIRTLFYRLVRLLGTPVQPIFVFDGPHKPAIKRNKRSGRGDGVATAQAKSLIRLFGFAIHDAPGEAEAECALLQAHGIVDAVLSEDVDTIMFGCTKTLRNWCAEGKSSKTPTHVSMYDVESMDIASLGLDRDGLVLVALMSGGDYLPEGIPGCGVKVACEAAKAGFGKSICRLKASDKDGLRDWKQLLCHELKTNEGGHFRTRHKALKIPEDFPNLEVLRYYTHPVVSLQSKLDTIREKLDNRRSVQVDALRRFARETFDWDYRIGAVKFIRVLAQALLVDKIIQGHPGSEKLVKRVANRRGHFSADGEPELRLEYIPEEVVPIDLSQEVDENVSYGRDGLALNSDDEFEPPASSLDPADGSRSAPGKCFDVSKPELAWVLEVVARKSVPLAVRTWEREEQIKASRKLSSKKDAGKRGKKKGLVPPDGTLDQFVRQTKLLKSAKDTIAATKASTSLHVAITQPSSHKSSRLGRRQTPESDTSKQTTPTIFKIPAEVPGTETSNRSPVTPRHHNYPGDLETIIISSSPASPASPLAPSPSSSKPQHISPQVGEIPDSIHSILSSEGISQGVKKHKQPLAKPTSPKRPGQKKYLKQVSIDMFTTRLTSTQPARPGPPEVIDLEANEVRDEPVRGTDLLDDDGDKFDFSHSYPSSTPSPTGKLYPSPETRPLAKKTPNTVDLGKMKRLLIPSTNAAGFMQEVQVCAEEYDERLAREMRRLNLRGLKSGVMRMSDVSVIDLTGDDD